MSIIDEDNDNDDFTPYNFIHLIYIITNLPNNFNKK